MHHLLQVNYVGKAANLYEDAGYKLSGSSYVINKLLGTTWLWDRVRVSGGAYGGFSDFDSHNGMFTFLSYRDPNLLKTVRHLCVLHSSCVDTRQQNNLGVLCLLRTRSYWSKQYLRPMLPMQS